MTNKYKNTSKKIIFSVYRNDVKSIKNMFNHVQTIGLLKDLGVDFEESKGVYKCDSEDSIIVYNAYKHFNLILDLATKYKQESILLIDKDNIANLYYLESQEVERLGIFTETTKDEVERLELDSYTLINDKYYTTFKEGDNYTIVRSSKFGVDILDFSDMSAFSFNEGHGDFDLEYLNDLETVNYEEKEIKNFINKYELKYEINTSIY